MDEFVESKPCFHWFTYPTGIKKKFFKKYLENPIGFFQLDSYFRWLANTEKPIGNINDLKDETAELNGTVTDLNSMKKGLETELADLENNYNTTIDENETLKGDINLVSNYINANEFNTQIFTGFIIPFAISKIDDLFKILLINCLSLFSSM